jgi:hypothetical protein
MVNTVHKTVGSGTSIIENNHTATPLLITTSNIKSDGMILTKKYMVKMKI